MPNDHVPGTIYARSRASQLRDFSGLRFRHNITPTDIDALLEFGDEVYVIVEVKYLKTELDRGQRLAFERLTDTLESAGKPTLCVCGVHYVSDSNEDIDVANCKAVKIRWQEHWYDCSSSDATIKEIIDAWLTIIGKKNLIRPIV